ncbi:MAG: NOL1/NOP2/sun family putative RNA methylase [Ignavibacteriae bacterium]|nr:NOL1/NOP2/sun family putative RNA methylase [Ignavibacteriota bacterium]
MIELSGNISDYIQQTFGNEFLENYKLFVESKYLPAIRFPIYDENISVTLKSLEEQGIELEQIPEIPNSYFVKKGDDIIGKTIEYTLGKYYIQSLSSMIPPLILNPNKTDVVLDLCAAPGSKSTQLAEIMNYKGTLFSNEPNLNRIKALVHNLDKMNIVNMSVIKDKGELLSKYFNNYFDKILVDAPCSALGVVQKKQEVSNWWSEKSANTISDLQLRLLISAIKMAKVGGEIVYSTCTLTVEENEFIIDKVLKKYPVELIEFDLNLKHINGFTEIRNYKFDESLSLTKRIIPWEIKSEGFFLAKLRKNGLTEISKIHSNKFSKKIIINYQSAKIKNYLLEISEYYGIPFQQFSNYKFLINGNDINFVNVESKEFDPDFFLRIGTKFGIIDKHNSLKLHSHAAQIIGKFAEKNIYEITNENDLKIYMSGGNIKSDFTENGQKIIKYKNMILGTGTANDQILKSQFPRSKRTANISIV